MSEDSPHKSPKVEKKAIDALGSVDDYGVQEREPIKSKTPDAKVSESSSKWKTPTIVEASPSTVVCGNEKSPKEANPDYLVGETRWGDKMTWPLKPYCVFCSPAAPKTNDTERIQGFDEYGAEKRMNMREHRLIGLSPDQHFSFSLIETDEGILCSKCGAEPLDEHHDEITPVVSVEQSDFDPAIFDATKLMLGIEVGEAMFRIPNDLVTRWVEQPDFNNRIIHIIKRKVIFSIKGKSFLSNAVYDKGNHQWLLNPQRCLESSYLFAKIKGKNLWADLHLIKEWRATALPMETKIVAKENGLYWSINQGDFLRGGFNVDGGWGSSLRNCEGPLFGITDCIPHIEDSEETETPDEHKNQSKLYHFKAQPTNG